MQDAKNTNNPAKPRTIIRKEKTGGQLPAESIRDIIASLSILRRRPLESVFPDTEEKGSS